MEFGKMNNQYKDNRAKLDELKNQVKDRLARPTLVNELTKQSDQKAAKNRGWISREIADDPGGFVLLVISSLFTAMLGIYLGLTPHLSPSPTHPGQMDIVFNTDFGHVVTAILYMASLIIVTEVAFFYSRHKYHIREEGNGHQLWTMWVALVLAFVSIVVTGGAGGTVVASTLGFLTEFKEVPPSLQKYLVWVIPSLFGFYLVLHTIYRLSSQQAKAERIAQQVKEQQELEHRMLMDQLELEGEEEIMLEEIEKYRDLVRRGKLTQGQARAARRAGKSIPELEKELNQDLDDNGHIGPPSVLTKLPQTAPAPQKQDDEFEWLNKLPASRRGSILPWHCTNCDNWYVSDSCPKCGMVAPELIPAKRTNGTNP
jgi:hypothetical protein